MLVRKEGYKYIIAENDGSIVRLNVKRTNEVIRNITCAARAISNTMKNCYDNNLKLYNLLKQNIFSGSFDFSDGKSLF